MRMLSDSLTVDPAQPEHYNRPGLPALAYRLDTHPTFLRRMFARLPAQTLPDGSRPLARLKTRDRDDPAIALLDAWATAADVLTFYQERIANEGYLSTAIERRSVLELARAIGYELHPGVASGAFLAFTVEEPDSLKTTRTVAVPKGTRVQSIPGQGQMPQTFETTLDIAARYEWNAIRPRLTRPQALNTSELYLAGVSLNLKAGDLLLLVYAHNDRQATQPVRIQRVVVERERGHTRVELTQALSLPESLSPRSLSVFAFRVRLGLFGHNAPNYTGVPETLQSTLYPYPWDPGGWAIWKDPVTNTDYAEADLYLECSAPDVVSGSWVVIEGAPAGPRAYQISAVSETSLTGFNLSGKATGLRLVNVTPGDKDPAFLVRKTTAYLQSEALGLAEQPIPDPVAGIEVALDRQTLGLEVGQYLIVSGKCVDGDKLASEVAVIEEVDEVAGHTRLRLRDGLENRYHRATVSLNANVARATHGETVREVLGSGDGAQSNQRFTLKRSPLTFISAPTLSGAQSTLEVRVNDVLWEEVASLHGLDSGSKRYQLRAENEGVTAVIFGDGEAGARLSSGTENVLATYRIGLGPEGEVEAHTLTLLQTRPLGIRSVTNPLPASGAAAPDDLEQARAKAPLNVLTIDRLVSLEDYEHFARTFAGVQKAQAVTLWNGQTQLAHLTVAGVNGDRIDPTSDLYLNLLDAINTFHDPVQLVRLDSYQPCFFRVTAKVLVDAHYRAAAVLEAIRSALTGTFSFEQRSFGQSVAAAELIAILQRVPGVVAIDLDQLYPSDELPGLWPRLTAHLARWEAAANKTGAGKFRPAQLLMVQHDGIKLSEMRR